MILKKIVLINPHHHFDKDPTTKMVLPPLGLAYLAAYLGDKGFLPIIIDANAENFTPAQVAKKVLTLKPDLVGIGAVTNTIFEAWTIAQLIKRKADLPLVLGGIHPTLMPDESLQKSFVDFVIRGEAEVSLTELATGIPKTEITGLSFKKGQKIIHNPPSPLTKNLDLLPFPARHLLPMEKYQTIGARYTPYATLISSRGCPYQCSFCSTRAIAGQSFRPRTAENVLAEIDQLVSDYGVREINILDDNFTLDPKRVEKICRLLIKRNYDLVLKNGNGVRIDSLTYPLLTLMKKAGWYSLAFGIESADQQILNKNNKSLRLPKVRQVIGWCRKLGIETLGFFIIGLPGETPKTLAKTINYAKNLSLDDAQFNLLIPFPGTPARKMIAQEGRILTSNWQDYNAYRRPVFELNNLTPDLMIKFQQQAYRHFYLRPKTLLKQFIKGRMWEKIKAGLKIMFTQN